MAAVFFTAVSKPCEWMADCTVACCNELSKACASCGECCEHVCDAMNRACMDCCNALSRCGNAFCNWVEHVFEKPFSGLVFLIFLFSFVPIAALIYFLANGWGAPGCGNPLHVWLLIALICFLFNLCFGTYLFSRLSNEDWDDVERNPKYDPNESVEENQYRRSVHFFLYDGWVCLFITLGLFELAWGIVGLNWASNASDTCKDRSSDLVKATYAGAIITLAFLGMMFVGVICAIYSPFMSVCLDDMTPLKCIFCWFYYPCMYQYPRNRPRAGDVAAQRRRDRERKAAAARAASGGAAGGNAPYYNQRDEEDAAYQPPRGNGSYYVPGMFARKAEAKRHEHQRPLRGQADNGPAPYQSVVAVPAPMPVAQPVAQPVNRNNNNNANNNANAARAQVSQQPAPTFIPPAQQVYYQPVQPSAPMVQPAYVQPQPVASNNPFDEPPAYMEQPQPQPQPFYEPQKVHVEQPGYNQAGEGQPYYASQQQPQPQSPAPVDNSNNNDNAMIAGAAVGGAVVVGAGAMYAHDHYASSSSSSSSSGFAAQPTYAAAPPGGVVPDQTAPSDEKKTTSEKVSEKAKQAATQASAAAKKAADSFKKWWNEPKPQQ